jgi:hypothetical protein
MAGFSLREGPSNVGTGSTLRVWFFGITGAVVGAAAYATFTILTGSEVVFVSVLLGAVVGWSVRLARSSLRREWASMISVLLTLIALLFSDYLIGRQLSGLTGGPLVPSADSFSFIEREHFQSDPMTLLFWGISLVAAGMAARPIQDTLVDAPGEDLPTRDDGAPVQGGPTGGSTQGEELPAPENSTWPRLVAWRHWTATFTVAFAIGAVAVLFLGTAPITKGDAAGPTLRVGHCYNDPTTGTGGSPREVPCADPHDEEVYYLFTLTGSSFPGDSAIEQEVDPKCSDQLSNYVGEAVTQYDYSYYTPDQHTWSLGDRTVACALARAAGSDLETLYGKKLRGTARGTP